ncbi:MAG TPA: GAF domain-containing protein [Polyangiaceae bacterium]|nr:GAF domain-containing protein [Polyangiaceae bacterium]
MSSQPPFLSVLKPNPPPIWYVTNGEVLVGPVYTSLLVRGVEEGRVPEHCRVSADSGRWRRLLSVREIAARHRLYASPEEVVEALAELEHPRERIRDAEELSHHATRLAMLVTRAECGMLHLRDRGARSFSTRAVLGPISTRGLSDVLPEADLVVRAAYLGRPVVGPPYGPVEDALALRFAGSEGGVGGAAMLPIFLGNSLVAMLELSRPGHAFRRSDLRRAERTVQRALFDHTN